MRDIVEEARNPDSSAYPSPAHYAARLEGLCQELADEIERLRGEIKGLKFEMRSLLQVTVGSLTTIEIQRDYGMLGWSVVNRCEDLTSAG